MLLSQTFFLNIINYFIFKIYKSIKYFFYFQSLNSKAIKDSSKNIYSFEDYALVKVFTNILDKDFNEIDQFLIDIKFPIFEYEFF